jgi:hypothetical protein
MPTYVPTYILKYMCFAVNSAEQESSFALKWLKMTKIAPGSLYAIAY